MNKELQNKIQTIEQLITQAKASLKTWANQISKYHKTLKTLSQELEAIKSQINMKPNQTLNQSNSSKKSSK